MVLQLSYLNKDKMTLWPWRVVHTYRDALWGGHEVSKLMCLSEQDISSRKYLQTRLNCTGCRQLHGCVSSSWSMWFAVDRI